MTSLAVFFCQYDTGRHPDAFPSLRAALGPAGAHRFFYVRIDNRNEGAWTRLAAPDELEAGGDNSLHEFSAWARGLEVFEEREGHPEGVLLVTDAFGAYGDDYSALLGAETLDFLMSETAVGGLVNRPGERRGLRGMGRDLDFWIRSSFVFVPGPVLAQLGPLATFTDVDEFCPRDWAGRLFLEEAPLNTAYRAYLEDWLTRRWHGAFAPSPATWDRFRQKLRSILNEHALTGRLVDMGVPLYDLRFLRDYRRCHGGGNIPEDYRRHPLEQFLWWKGLA